MLDANNSRFPVFDKNIDHIIGILHLKDACRMNRTAENGALPVKNIQGLLREAEFVAETKKIDTLFRDMQKRKIQMVIVIDEYGQTAGLVAMEDILEEIVGEYEDEFTRQARRVKKLVGSQYEIDASMRVSDLEALLDFPFPKDDDYVTLAGLFYKKLGSVPRVGDSVMLEGARLTVIEMDNHRITLLKFEDTAIGDDGVVRLVDNSSAADPAALTPAPQSAEGAAPAAGNSAASGDAPKAEPQR